MSDRSRARLRMVALTLVAFVLQGTVAPDLRVQGVAPDLMLVTAICAALSGGARHGAIVGFGAGLLADLSLTDTPVGLSALVFCLTGYLVGVLRENVLPEGHVLHPMLAMLATAAGVALFVGVGDIVGQTELVAVGRNALIRTGVIEALWSAVLSVPFGWAWNRAAAGSEGASVLDGGRRDRATAG